MLLEIQPKYKTDETKTISIQNETTFGKIICFSEDRKSKIKKITDLVIKKISEMIN